MSFTWEKRTLLGWVWPVAWMFVGGLAVYHEGRVNGQVQQSSAYAATAPDTSVLPETTQSLNVFSVLAKKSIPSVVNISTQTIIKNRALMPREFFSPFFEGGELGRAPYPSPRALPRATALGTGFVIDPSGIILTNNHVIADADEIKIQFTESPDEKPTEGKVIGRDPDLDISLIQVDTSRPLTALSLGDSDALEVGEYVMAVGNPFGNGHSVSHGIVSAKGRISPGVPLARYLQIDAPINPGNSGGPLLNLKGEVVGINNAIDARAQGIGFAIPINDVKKILDPLKTHGKVQRGYIGAVVGQLTPEIAGKLRISKDLQAPIVTEVNPGTPAYQAGLQPYDVITEIAGVTVHTSQELVQAITALPVGKSVPIKIERNGKNKILNIVTSLRPSAV